MKCPSCSAQAGDDAVECSSCGVIFAKWREARKKEAQEAAAALERPSESVDPRQHQVLMAAAVVLAVAWMVLLALYYYRSLSQIKRRAVDSPRVVEMRDPETGVMRRVMILGPAAAPASPPIPPVAAPPAVPPPAP